MTAYQVGSLLIGGFGAGSVVVSLYIRSTIAETIIGKLNGRYVNAGVCAATHKGTLDQLAQVQTRFDQRVVDLNGRMDRLQNSVDKGFEALHPNPRHRPSD